MAFTTIRYLSASVPSLSRGLHRLQEAAKLSPAKLVWVCAPINAPSPKEERERQIR